MAALSRMANDEHRQITIQQDDLVIMASSLIPGNENAITRVINGLMSLGAHVVHQGNAHVHVSGHASEGELQIGRASCRERVKISGVEVYVKEEEISRSS